jgi:hypothetical protein
MRLPLVARTVLVCTVLFVSIPAAAQVTTGDIVGVVKGADGAPVSGATVTLTPPQGEPMVQVTNAAGEFRYPGLRPGAYTVTASRGGEPPTPPSTVRVSMGTQALKTVTLGPSAPAETVTVTAETPLIDTGRITTYTLPELEKIPTARDPWAILQQTPGVLVDRINVGGSENGQGVGAAGPGATPDQTQWMLDGADLSDPSGGGTPPTYFDFDGVDEIRVQTGGSDSSTSTGGVRINITTKRGTNEWTGSVRYYLGLSGEDDAPTSSEPSATGTTMDQSNDFGATLGGYIVRDKLWFFGSWGTQRVQLNSFGTDAPFDRSVNRSTGTIRLDGNWQSTDRYSLSFTRTGRTATGLSQNPTRLATSFRERTSPATFQIEDTHIFSPNFYLTGLLSMIQGGFTVTPPSGQALFSGDGVDRGFFNYDANRDGFQIRLDGGRFIGGPLNHDLKFGIGYRGTRAADAAHWTEDTLIFEDSGDFLQLRTPRSTRETNISHGSFYLQDTLKSGKFSATFGIRLDSQHGTPGTSTMTFPFNSSLPAIRFTGESSIDWTTISPRAGVTYGLGEDGRTLLRASFGRFPQLLTAPHVNFLNPIEPLLPLGSEVYFFDDLNNNRAFDPNEPREFLGYPFLAPTDPALLEPLNQVDIKLDAPVTDELMFGIEHALLPEFVIGLNVTRRSVDNVLQQTPIVDERSIVRPATNLDFIAGDNLSGSFNIPGFGQGTYNAPVFQLRPSLFETGGVRIDNGTRGQEYTSALFSFNKRLANRWLLRGFVEFSDWKWSGAADAADRSDELRSTQDGGVVAPQSPAIGREHVYLNRGWSFNVNGLYQVSPDKTWGFDLSTNIFGRQGFPAPLFRSAEGGRVPVLDIDRFRYDSPVIVDLQAAKTIIVGNTPVRLSIEAFNFFNNQTVMQRDLNLDQAQPGQRLEVLQPRVIRLGARFTF